MIHNYFDFADVLVPIIDQEALAPLFDLLGTPTELFITGNDSLCLEWRFGLEHGWARFSCRWYPGDGITKCVAPRRGMDDLIYAKGVLSWAHMQAAYERMQSELDAADKSTFGVSEDAHDLLRTWIRDHL